MDYPFCEKTNCGKNKKEHCILKNPEKYDGTCLHYEDIVDSLRWKVDIFQGKLRRVLSSPRLLEEAVKNRLL